MHPEFGYLWLSPEARRVLRVAVAAGACGILVGSVGTRALVSSDRGHAGSGVMTTSPSLATAEAAPKTPPGQQGSEFAAGPPGAPTQGVAASAHAAPTRLGLAYGSDAAPTLVPRFPAALASVPVSETSSSEGSPSATPKRHQRIAKARPVKRPHEAEEGYSLYVSPYRSGSRESRQALHSAPGWGW